MPFNYQIVDGKASPSNPNTPELKALHNNIEYTYQLLAQLRIHMIDNATNQITWSDAELAASTQRCLNNKEIGRASCRERV